MKNFEKYITSIMDVAACHMRHVKSLKTGGSTFCPLGGSESEEDCLACYESTKEWLMQEAEDETSNSN